MVLLIAKLGFIANEAVTGLKLLELGFSKEDLALTVLIDFPFEILFGYYAAKWSSGSKPLQPVQNGREKEIFETFKQLDFYYYYFFSGSYRFTVDYHLRYWQCLSSRDSRQRE